MAGVKVGDIITHVNNEKVSTGRQVTIHLTGDVLQLTNYVGIFPKYNSVVEYNDLLVLSMPMSVTISRVHPFSLV